LDSSFTPMSVTASNSLWSYTLSGGGAIAGTIGLTKFGTNTFTLATANTYSGATTVNEGILALSGPGTFGLPSTALILGGGCVDLGGLSATVGPVTINTAPASGNTLQNGDLTGSSYRANLESGIAIVTANLLGTGTLAKYGAGTLVLAGANTYSGATTVNKGFLTLSETGSLIAGTTVTVGSATPGTLTIDGGTLNCGGNNLQTGSGAGHIGAI
jgi:autotransporter-associated beta strand protein